MFSHFLFLASHLIQHNLPQCRLVSVFGSKGMVDVMPHHCLKKVCLTFAPALACSMMEFYQCSVKSAIIKISRPVVHYVKTWYTSRIILSFEVELANYSHIELAVFNCLELVVNTPLIIACTDTSFRNSSERDPGMKQIANKSVTASSCEYLLKINLEFSCKAQLVQYFNIEFPCKNNSNSLFVFLGEPHF